VVQGKQQLSLFEGKDEVREYHPRRYVTKVNIRNRLRKEPHPQIEQS
jgi:hypothetical protein